jgi:hypothetical protein
MGEIGGLILTFKFHYRMFHMCFTIHPNMIWLTFIWKPQVGPTCREIALNFFRPIPTQEQTITFRDINNNNIDDRWTLGS